MTGQTNIRLISSLRSFSRAASIFGILVGCLVLVAWMFDIATLKSVFPGLVTMKANTALSFVLVGIALWILLNDQPDTSRPFNFTRRCLIAQACAVIIALIGLLTLFEYFLGLGLGIDQLLFKESLGALGTSAPGRMAPTTALNFFMIGLALIFLGTPHSFRASQFLSLAIGLIGLLNFTGYIYGVKSLYGLASYTQMAVHTAATFTVLSVGILFARADVGFMAFVTSDSVGGITARRLLPAAIVIPILLGWLRLQGELAGLYGVEFGVALSTLAIIVIFSVLIWWVTRTLHQAETDRKRTQEALEQKRSILDSILSSMGDGVVVADMQGKFLIWNKAAERLVGLGPAELPTQEWSKHYGVFLTDQLTPYPPEQLPLTRALRGEPVDADEQFLRRPDLPEGIWLSVTGRPLIDAQGVQRGGVVVFNDISERKRAERALEESEKKFAQIFALSPAVITINRLPDGQFVDVNPMFTKLYGYEREEVIGKRSVDIQLIDPSIRETLLQTLREQQSVGNVEVKVRTKSGKIIDALSSMKLIEFGGEQYILSLSYDITERKQAEEKIKQLNKELEAFSYSVSHDLRAPLRHIDGFIDLTQKHASAALDQKSHRYLKIISDSAKHMGNLIDDLLVFSRMGRTEMRKTHVNLEQLVKETIASLGQDTQGRSIDWKIDPLPEVEADPSMLRLALQNLISNAVKYTRTRERAEIEIGCMTKDSENIFFVRDNGVGFDMQYVDKLFGVFQRLHRSDEFEGTGIGLANVQRIIQRHGGKTWAEGKVNEGATFYFSLPRQTDGARLPERSGGQGLRNYRKG